MTRRFIKFRLYVSLIGKHDNDTYDQIVISTPSFKVGTEEYTNISVLNIYDIKTYIDKYIEAINCAYCGNYTEDDFDIYVGESNLWASN